MLTLCLTIQNIKAQITLEHTYSNSGHFEGYLNTQGSSTFGSNLFYLIHLEVDGDKYIQINKQSQLINFYNLDHSLWKSIDYSNVQQIISAGEIYNLDQCSMLYFSQKLFDTDNEIEFLYTFSSYDWSVDTYYAITHIVNEDGTINFTRNASPAVQPTYHNQNYPIYNTAQGTKMILSNENGTAEVFSLGGTFTALIKENNPINNLSMMNIFPNPSISNQIITIEYTLPELVNSAIIKIVNSNGESVKEINISNQSNKTVFSNEGLSSGIYFYSIVSLDGNIIIGKTLINI